MSTETQQSLAAAAEALEARLDDEDGKILAAMAFYRTNIIEAFGHDGVVEVLRSVIDESQYVKYYSRRARREIDPVRPSVNLAVDDAAAIAADSGLALQLGLAGFVASGTLAAELQRMATSGSDADENRLVDIKSNIVFEQVCRPMASKMNEMLAPYWAKSRGKLAELGLDEKRIRMLLCNIFSIRVADGRTSSGKERMAILSLII